MSEESAETLVNPVAVMLSTSGPHGNAQRSRFFAGDIPTARHVGVGDAVSNTVVEGLGLAEDGRRRNDLHDDVVNRCNGSARPMPNAVDVGVDREGVAETRLCC